MGRLSFNIPKDKKHLEEAGFSLLEMLVALVIMSLTSLALFQSIGTMLYVSDRAVQVSEDAVEMTISHRTMSRLIDGLVPAWSSNSEDSFSGQRLSFSGMSANAVHSNSDENASFTLSLQIHEGIETTMVYEAQNVNWTLATTVAGAFYFEYLDKKNIWHEQWPPTEKQAPASEDIFSQLEVIKLPKAIRLNHLDGNHKAVYVVGRYQSLLDRVELGREQ